MPESPGHAQSGDHVSKTLISHRVGCNPTHTGSDLFDSVGSTFSGGIVRGEVCPICHPGLDLRVEFLHRKKNVGTTAPKLIISLPALALDVRLVLQIGVAVLLEVAFEQSFPIRKRIATVPLKVLPPFLSLNRPENEQRKPILSARLHFAWSHVAQASTNRIQFASKIGSPSAHLFNL